MIEFVVLAACWLLLSLPVSVLVGRCIAVGQAGETARHAAAHAAAGAGAGASAPAAEAVGGSAGSRGTSGAELPPLPAQRRPAASRLPVR